MDDSHSRLPRRDRAPTHLFVTLGNAAPGRTAEYATWQVEQHVGETLECEGFVRAQRFQRVDLPMRTNPYGFLTLYDLVTDDLAATLAGMRRRATGEEAGMHIPHELLGAPASSWAFESQDGAWRDPVRWDEVLLVTGHHSKRANDWLDERSRSTYRRSPHQVTRLRGDVKAEEPPLWLVLEVVPGKRDDAVPQDGVSAWVYRPVSDAMTAT